MLKDKWMKSRKYQQKRTAKLIVQDQSHKNCCDNLASAHYEIMKSVKPQNARNSFKYFAITIIMEHYLYLIPVL